MNLKTARIAAYLLLALMIVSYVLLLAIGNHVPTWLWMITIFCGLAYLTIYLLFWRCPHCRRHLGRSWCEYCPHCGQHLY